MTICAMYGKRKRTQFVYEYDYEMDMKFVSDMKQPRQLYRTTSVIGWFSHPVS